LGSPTLAENIRWNKNGTSEEKSKTAEILKIGVLEKIDDSIKSGEMLTTVVRKPFLWKTNAEVPSSALVGIGGQEKVVGRALINEVAWTEDFS
jgi:hypothetical protein